MIDGSESKPPLNALEKFCCGLTGTDPHILQQGPPRDRSAVVTIGLIMLAVFVWQSVAFAFTAHLFLAAPGEVRPELAAIAILFATIIMLGDGMMVIRASWWFSGLDQLKRGGLEVPGYTKAKIKNHVLNGVRIALALVPAELTALGVALFIFQAELGQVLNAEAVQRNAGLTQQIAERDDADTGRMAENLNALQTGRTQAAANAEALRADALRVQVDDPELGTVTARITGLEAGKLEAERRLAAIPRTRSREEAERRYIAQRLLTARRADLDKAQAAQQTLRQRADAARREHAAMVAARLKDATDAEAAYQARIIPLATALAERAAARADRIRNAVERDAAYVPPERGVLARMRALADLTRLGWNFTLLMLLHGFFLGIELAAVLAKMLSAVPSSYAVRLAGEEYATEVETVDAVFKRLGGRGDADEPVPPDEPDNTPMPPASGAANDDGAQTDTASDPESDMDARLREGARAARAQAAARAKAKDQGREKSAEAAGESGVVQTVLDVAAAPVRRGPGRPPGTRNRPSPANDDSSPREDGQDVA